MNSQLHSVVLPIPFGQTPTKRHNILHQRKMLSSLDIQSALLKNSHPSLFRNDDLEVEVKD